MCGLFHKQGLRSFLYENDIEYFIGYKNKNMISIDIKMVNVTLIITSFKGYINVKY